VGRADIGWTVTASEAWLSAEERVMNVNDEWSVAGQLLHAAATAIEDSTHEQAHLHL
jgi:hypothetical protein